ncbi:MULTISPECIES: GNAT family N-acetyltransferase [unclassified Microbacterium]|uniref:GNAT family N-acetyltransferase n=1 Tax=unclassified Microbacterium TaxID=2609290 RepID=UPI001605295A|nr:MULTISPECIES: GNAT family N-acetyltransferase [unclassified Microbacterium]QNA91672.1 N-acetyltransferase [Microbacterium sp. Se63.02b]QYM64858.1 N-acetyltransferase [Microbacterium sp. Se5.02b]
MTDITVTRDDDASRYEIRSGDVLAGFAAFDLRPGSIRFLHTEIDPAFQGQGLAGKLAETALADAVERGEAIVPLCPYIAKYLETHEVPGAEIRWPAHAPEQGGSVHDDPTGRAE